MKYILPPLILVLCLQASAQPTNNPVLDAFPANQTVEHFGWTFGDYSWTDSIKWDTVTTSAANGADAPTGAPNAIKSDILGSPADDLATIQGEIDTISAAGGGVLYVPAGTYYFSDNIYLKDGVVIRGVTPTQSDARQSDYAPTTKFVFPRIQGIVSDSDVPGSGQRLDSASAQTFTTSGDAASTVKVVKVVTVDQATALTMSNYGIVNVDINRGRIDFLKEEKADGSIDKFSVNFGTDDKNRLEGGNVVVFGCRVNNSIQLDFEVPNADPDYNDWQVWTNRAKSSIDVMAKENIVIANNRVNDNHWQYYVNSQPFSQYPVDDFWMPTDGPGFPSDTQVYLNKGGSRMTDAGETGLVTPANKYILFNYARGIGITANRTSRVGYGTSGPSSPAGEPSLHRQGVIVRQNWVYTNDRVGISVAGQGVEVRDNVRRDIPGQQIWIRSDGKEQQTVGSTTFENRGIDLSGINIFCDGNDYEVYSRNMPLAGNNKTIDGEGILVQPNDAGIMYNQTITNNTGNSYIGIFKMPDIRNINISGNTVTSAGTGGIEGARDILVWADPNFFPGIARNLVIDNNTIDGTISITSGLVDLGAPHTITNNKVGGNIEVPDYTDSTQSPASIFNDTMYANVSGNTDLNSTPIGLTFKDWTIGAGRFTGEFVSSNLIDTAPIVEIVHPTPETVLVAGQPITVEVEITMDETFGFNPLASVILYDCSQLDPNQQIFKNDHRTDANSLAGATTLTSTNATTLGSGTYTASWTPSQAYLDYGLFVVEALMTEVTVKDGVNGGEDSQPDGTLADRPLKDSTFALLGRLTTVVPAGDVEIVSVSRAGNTLSITIVDGGLTYEVGTADSFATAPSAWPALTTEVAVGAPSGGEIVIDVDVSALADNQFFVVRGN